MKTHRDERAVAFVAKLRRLGRVRVALHQPEHAIAVHQRNGQRQLGRRREDPDDATR